MIKRTLFFLLVFFFWADGSAQSEIRIKQFNLSKGIAIDGYDPVSYFDGKPALGKQEFKYTHAGITYLFSTATNLARFKQSPSSYEPAYGGWCAYAMGKSGEKVKIDPLTYKVKDGKLYLFYNFWGNNTLQDWNKDEVKLTDRANQNWKKFVQ
ncbi:MAG: YHS domain protein [Cyclobacteriaceae bacterium]|nr:YHS domain protein [Cyclobacteriaceae bacterium]